MKLRVPGNYTGHYGPTEFVNGVSVGLVSPRWANNLKASMQGVEILQDDGETIDEALNSIFPILPLDHYIDSGTEPPSPYLTRWDGTYPPVPEPAVEGEDPSNAQTPPQAPPAWTQEALSAVADEKGIQGLREIADPLGVKGRSIAELIAAILSAGPGAAPTEPAPAESQPDPAPAARVDD